MSKTSKAFIKRKVDKNGNTRSGKTLSHGTHRCERKPNSKICKSGHLT
jgi:hypothetical protein